MKTKNAIVGLTRGYQDIKRYDLLIRRNQSIYNKIYTNLTNDFDVILFHEGNITKEQQTHIQNQTPNLPLIFINIKEVEPKSAFNDSLNIINRELCPPTSLSSSFGLGYKHMCHFWSIDFMVYLNEYNIIMRLDEDCIINNIDIDPFKYLTENNIKYISPYFQGQDHPDVIVGLKTLWDNFISSNNITSVKGFSEILCPQTNFMVIDLEYFKNNELVIKLLKEINDSHGIYSNRWGDLPIWGLILSTLINEEYYEEIKKISYYHGSWNKHIN